jgi:hypothetical protein
MSFWNGTQWVTEEHAPNPKRTHFSVRSATLVSAITLAAALLMPLSTVAAAAHHTSSTVSCTLSSVVLGGSAVIEIDAVGVRHSSNFKIEWVEPAITQTEYMWSTSTGTLQDTVMNDQGSGTYSASLYWRSNSGDVWEASCSTSV